jgi:hypothetical protein
MRELMARVKVLLRRAPLTQTRSRRGREKVSPSRSAAGSLRLSATGKGGAVPLTVTEFVLLQALVRRPGIVKTRDQLMERPPIRRVSVTDRTIDSHIKRIRASFSKSTARSRGLESVLRARIPLHTSRRDETSERGIALRLFAFNLLLLFLPIAAFCTLTCTRALLTSQERSMVQQARLVSAAMSTAPASISRRRDDVAQRRTR